MKWDVFIRFQWDKESFLKEVQDPSVNLHHVENAHDTSAPVIEQGLKLTESVHQDLLRDIVEQPHNLKPVEQQE